LKPNVSAATLTFAALLTLIFGAARGDNSIRFGLVDPPGTTAIEALDINEAGTIVGWGHYPRRDPQAFEMGDPFSREPEWIPPLRNGLGNYARGINESGVIVGESHVGGTTTIHAYTYDSRQTNPFRDLGSLGGYKSVAYAVNDSGVVVGSSTLPGALLHQTHAFLHLGSASDQMIDLGTLGGFSSSAADINNANEIVGFSHNSSELVSAFYVGPDRVMRDLGTLAPGRETGARAINNRGIIVGISGLKAFVVGNQPGDVMTPLATPGPYSQANDINDLGFIVGSVQDVSNEAFAALWTPSGELINLEALVAQQYPDDYARWNLGPAVSISNTGLIIGTGYYDNDGQGTNPNLGGSSFIIDASSLMPEPGALWVGMLFTIATRRRI
jgi:probable HAF family extracellular repeat protein